MNLFDELLPFGERTSARPSPSTLYDNLQSGNYNASKYNKEELGENMMVINEVIAEYWKPRFLLNNALHLAYEFMNEHEHLVDIGDECIDWESLNIIRKKDRDECIEMAKCRNAMFPTFIRDFSNGVARVDWQLKPNGYYWRDDDGFGMTGDEEITIYGFIDTSCQVVLPFRAVRSYDEVNAMRLSAENIVKRKNM